MSISRKQIFLYFILLLSLSFRLFIYNILPLDKLFSQNFFLFELINIHFSIPVFFVIILGLMNLFLVFLIGEKTFKPSVGIYSALVYAISPWVAYLEVGGSIYIFLLTLLLILFYCSLNIENRNKYFKIGIFVSSALLLFSSLFMWIILPVLFLCLYKLKIIENKFSKKYLTSFVCMFFIILTVPLSNINSFKNIFAQQVTLFSNVGLVNAVNSFRGEVRQTNFAMIGKFIENRYFYLSEHVMFNALNHLTPATYFTQEFKMFNFSFSPPLLIGFLFPFLYGLKYVAVKLQKKLWVLLGVSSLLLPSILSKNSPDIARLVLISPVFFILVGFGINYIGLSKSKVVKYILFASLLLVLIQSLTTVSDIALHEKNRLQEIQKT